MSTELFNLKGKVEVRLNDEVVRNIDNLVVTDGKEFVASSMIKTTSNSPAAMTHMGIGSGSTSAAAGNSALESQLGRVALTGGTGTVSGAVVTYVATFPAGTGTGAVTEAGILNANTSGELLCRTVFSVVNKGSSDSMTITWTVTVS